MAVYLIECQICGEKYTESTKTKFRSRANDYKAVTVQIEDWVLTLIDSASTLKELRR